MVSDELRMYCTKKFASVLAIVLVMLLYLKIIIIEVEQLLVSLETILVKYNFSEAI